MGLQMEVGVVLAFDLRHNIRRMRQERSASGTIRPYVVGGPTLVELPFDSGAGQYTPRTWRFGADRSP